MLERKKEIEELKKTQQELKQAISKIYETLRFLIDTESKTQRAVSFLIKEYEERLKSEDDIMFR